MIGAGAAGLVAARELVREGHTVTVFEKGSQSGGVWLYTDDVESPDLLGESHAGILHLCDGCYAGFLSILCMTCSSGALSPARNMHNYTKALHIAIRCCLRLHAMLS